MKLPLKILIHGIFWVVFCLFTFVMDYAPKPGDWPRIEDVYPHLIINTIWAMVIFYLFYFYFIRFFEKKQLVKYLLFSIVLSILVTALFIPLHTLFIHTINIFKAEIFGPPIAGTFIIAQCGCLVRGFENWFTNIQLKAELENRNLKNELELLKSQINPHFLFNSLNNIDSLIHTLPGDASNSLITLSDMLRYMLYETRTDKVNLQNEINYIKNYIRLQQLRFREKDYIKTVFPGDCAGIMIAPMIFIPFIENAFKFSTYTGILPVIEISLKCEGDQIYFTCKNYYKKTTTNHGGLGLENTKRRLELIYPGKYRLTISEKDIVYDVELIIDRI